MLTLGRKGSVERLKSPSTTGWVIICRMLKEFYLKNAKWVFCKDNDLTKQKKFSPPLADRACWGGWLASPWGSWRFPGWNFEIYPLWNLLWNPLWNFLWNPLWNPLWNLQPTWSVWLSLVPQPRNTAAVCPYLGSEFFDQITKILKLVCLSVWSDKRHTYMPHTAAKIRSWDQEGR